MKEYDLQVPQMPGFHLPSWIKRQTALLHGLARKAHRNSKAAPAMDGDQTLEYPAEDCAPSMHQCTYTAYTQHTYITYCFPKHSLTYLLPCLLTYTYMSHTCTHFAFFFESFTRTISNRSYLNQNLLWIRTSQFEISSALFSTGGGCAVRSSSWNPAKWTLDASIGASLPLMYDFGLIIISETCLIPNVANSLDLQTLTLDRTSNLI